MIELGINLRDEFKNEVKNFCSENNIEWSNNIYTENMNSEGVVGQSEQLKCDNCKCTPTVIHNTASGRFCEACRTVTL